LLCLVSPAAALALVPHQFWSQRKSETRRKVPDVKEKKMTALSMYFDDHERLQDSEGEELFLFQNFDKPWISSLSNEKRCALEKFIGYNPVSASKLTNDQVEEETLRWLIDTDILVTDDGETPSDDVDRVIQEDSDRRWRAAVKYGSIKDLLVASSCNSTLESLTFLWNAIADTIEDEISSSQSQNSVKLIVFPKSESLWNYDAIVTMLEAIQIAKPLLPNQFDLRLDLFHPDYKHSPRMWSPQWHSPFPTVGLTIQVKEEPSIDELDLDALRSKLDAVFRSGDATRKDDKQSFENHAQVLDDCQNWVQEERTSAKTEQTNLDGSHVNEADTNWIVQSRGSPFELYRTVWNSALNLSTGEKTSSIICDPFLDSHTLHRVAITVNAALKKLNIPVRITQVYHPFTKQGSGNNEYKTRPPYGMIQLSLSR